MEDFEAMAVMTDPEADIATLADIQREMGQFAGIMSIFMEGDEQ